MHSPQQGYDGKPELVPIFGGRRGPLRGAATVVNQPLAVSGGTGIACGLLVATVGTGFAETFSQVHMEVQPVRVATSRKPMRGFVSPKLQPIGRMLPLERFQLISVSRRLGRCNGYVAITTCSGCFAELLLAVGLY